MAIISDSNQYLYTGKGPLDAKSLVKTYAELLDRTTWEYTDAVTGKTSFIAYNGMIVAVWLNKEDSDKNGIYYLYDAEVTTVLAKPDVTNVANWHKLSGEVNLSAIQGVLDNHDSRLYALEHADTVHTYGYKKDFPVEGQQNHMYIAADQHRTYVFVSGTYLPIADQFEYTDHDNNLDTPEVRIIYGGSAD